MFVVSNIRISIVCGAVVIGSLYFPANIRVLVRGVAFKNLPVKVPAPLSVVANVIVLVESFHE